MTQPPQRQRANAPQPVAKKSGDVWKLLRIPLIILILWGASMGVAWQVTKDGPRCPGHWHAVVEYYVDGDRIEQEHPKWTLEGQQGMPLSTHMHRGNTGVWHFEPPTPECIPLEDALVFMDASITDTELVLTGAHADFGQDGTFVANETHTLRAWRQPFGGDWKEASPQSLADRQLRDGDRVLFVYGDDADDAIESYQASVKAFPENLEPQDASSPVAYIVLTVLALVALAIWNSIRKKV